MGVEEAPTKTALLLAPALNPSIVIDDRRKRGAYSEDADTARNHQARYHSRISIPAGLRAGNSRMISGCDRSRQGQAPCLAAVSQRAFGTPDELGEPGDKGAEDQRDTCQARKPDESCSQKDQCGQGRPHPFIGQMLDTRRGRYAK